MDHNSKNKVLSCMIKGPGPKYQMKTLTGFDDHDPSKRRNPAYSMAFLPKRKMAHTGPGPYYVANHLTNRGYELSPAYTMGLPHYKKYYDTIPGPNAYSVEKVPPMNHDKRAAAFTLVFKHDKVPYKDGPGPIYMLPTCIGPEIPDIRAQAAYSILARHKQKLKSIGPGPAAYDINLNTYKRRYPAYSFKFRRQCNDQNYVPGPKYSYNINTVKKRQPVYSFGVRYSECTSVGITDDD